jgi:hypothetical protein
VYNRQNQGSRINSQSSYLRIEWGNVKIKSGKRRKTVRKPTSRKSEIETETQQRKSIQTKKFCKNINKEEK